MMENNKLEVIEKSCDENKEDMKHDCQEQKLQLQQMMDTQTKR